MSEYEQTLLIKPECFVYKIPPRPNAAGWKAADWNVEAFIWTGKLTVVAKGDICTVKMIDVNTGDVFAQCPVGDSSVEPVIDSSRYFVLKVEDGQGRHAFLGLGFQERNDAFDFNVTLQDHLRYLDNHKKSEKAMQDLENDTNKTDYSLKDGQKIHVSVSLKKPVSKSTGNTSGTFGLAPPPGSKKKPSSSSSSSGSNQTAPKRAPQQQQQQVSQNNNSDPFGDFQSGNNNSSNNDWFAFQQ